jgi:hypothetical protein
MLPRLEVLPVDYFARFAVDDDVASLFDAA